MSYLSIFLWKDHKQAYLWGIHQKQVWWRKSVCKVRGPQKYQDKFDPLRRWLIVYLSLLVSWSYNDYCQQGCPFLWQSWHCWVQIKGKSDFLVSERVAEVGEGQNLSFPISLLTVLSLSRRLTLENLNRVDAHWMGKFSLCSKVVWDNYPGFSSFLHPLQKQKTWTPILLSWSFFSQLHLWELKMYSVTNSQKTKGANFIKKKMDSTCKKLRDMDEWNNYRILYHWRFLY